jgi:hypothetical protein
MRTQSLEKTMKRLLAAAAVLATLTHTAFAGELTLFADSDFRGARVTLQGDARDLRQLNFNDRVSSLIVRSGTWELCQDSNFSGRCAQFGPGEYRALPNFNDAISSVRELRGPGAWRDGERDGRREEWREHEERREEWREREGYRGEGYRGGAPVELFAGPRFEGPEVAVGSDVRSLDDVGFNDRAVSIIIREGRWEFCEHGDFRGQCVVYGPGRYPFLEGMNNRISSMRRVR